MYKYNLFKIFIKIIKKIISLFYSNHYFSLSIFNIKNDMKNRDENFLNYGFLFQGPISKNTNNIINSYRKFFPDSLIVLSTWEDQKIFFDSNKNIEIIQNKYPKNTGIMNFNLQLVSTTEGIKRINQDQMIDKIFKLRTDYVPSIPYNIIDFVNNLEKKFNINDRIWGLDVNTSKNIPYSFSDMFQFSSKEKINEYWLNVPMQNMNINAEEFLKITNNLNDIKKVFEYRPSEIYLLTNYLRIKNIEFDIFDINQYHKILGKYFGILDSNLIGFAFDKYSIIHPNSSYEISKVFTKHQNFFFNDWLNNI